MIGTTAPARSELSEPDRLEAHARSFRRVGRVRIPVFWRHFLEMIVVMWVGMAAGGAVFGAIHGVSRSEAYQRYPWQAVLSMALSMAIPMAAWMLVRGHGLRHSGEMAAAMLVPAIPFVILCSMHVLAGSPAAGISMALSLPAMLGLMLYRRDAYSMPMPAPWRRRQVGGQPAP